MNPQSRHRLRLDFSLGLIQKRKRSTQSPPRQQVVLMDFLSALVTREEGIAKGVRRITGVTMKDAAAALPHLIN